MAKKAKTVAPVYNVALLKEVASATAQGGFVYVSDEDAKPLIDLGFIIQNAQVVENGKKATKTTDSGNAEANKPADAPADTAPAQSEAAANYQIFTGIVLPPSKRGGNKAGAPQKYPFDKLEVGGGFFEPTSVKMPDPVKTLSSTVSSVNKRFAKPTGEVKTVTRTKRGDGNKAVVDAAGNKVKEQKQVPVTKAEKRFVVRSVKAGEKFGELTIPADGALVVRVAVE